MTPSDHAPVPTGALPDDEHKEPAHERLNRLEAELTALRAEVRLLRDGANPRHSGVRASPPRSDGPARPRPLRTHRKFPDLPGVQLPPLEELLGRYGMLALGVLTVLAGAGIFLSWAIREGLLGPTVRVLLGAIGALALAAVGLRMRSRNLKDFGNVMLALALAVVHVVSWSAGPLLHVVPSVIAFGVACLASLVLAELALRKDEQALFCVGFGGAALAPFVTSSGGDSLLALATYGVTILALAASALRDRSWSVARRMMAATFGYYLFSIIVGRGRTEPADDTIGAIERLAAIGFVVTYVASVALLAHRRYRHLLLRIGAFGLVVATAVSSTNGFEWAVALVVSTAGAALLIGLLYVLQPPTHTADLEAITDAEAMKRARRHHTFAYIDGALLPVLLMMGTISTVDGSSERWQSAIALGWAVPLVVLTKRSRGEVISNAFAIAASVAVIVGAGSMPLLPWAASTALAMAGVAIAATHTRLPRPAFVGGAALALLMASARAYELLTARELFGYTPFFQSPSLAAAAVVAGWFAASRLLRQDDTVSRWLTVPTGTLMRWGAAAFGFAWVQSELAGAFSPTAAYALLVGLYAVTGFSAIEWGRITNARTVRLAGLAISVMAAGKALSAMLTTDSIPTRIGVLFGVSVFLIGVAYRYRQFLGAPKTPA